MKWLNYEEMKVLLVGFMVAIVLSGGSVKADYAWTRKADMPTPRHDHTSAVVSGKIYVIGGGTSETESGGWMPLSTVEEYDPASDTWTRKADMPTARCDMIGSSAVVDGKIYVIGGDTFDGGYRCIPTVEEYDPATDTWTMKADMPTPRWSLATCAVDGKIYAIGGAPADSYNALNVVEQYDPRTDTWTRKANMPNPLWGLCACVIDGKIYTLGGRPRYAARAFVQEYDPATDAWTQKRDMPQKTSQMVSVVLGDKIVVIGGWNYSNLLPHTTIQIYDPETDIWTLEEDVPFLRALATGEVVNNRIYIIGGTDRPHPCPALSTVYTNEPIVDFNGDEIVDLDDLLVMIENWGTDNSLCDIGPIMPWGDNIVDMKDLEVFINYWEQQRDPSLLAYWKLDETEYITVHDSSRNYDGIVYGEPVWQPEGGMIDGTIELDGIDDYISTPFILNPRETSEFSVFAWIKGGLPGQVIISQANSANWLSVDTEGCLMTELKGGRGASALISDVVITDGDWHRIGFTWDGDYRILYVDDVIATIDTQNALPSSEEGLYIGAGKNLEPGTFFSGLIDDVRIYNRVITP